MENLLIPQNKSNYGPKSPWTYTQEPYPIQSSVEFFFRQYFNNSNQLFRSAIDRFHNMNSSFTPNDPYKFYTGEIQVGAGAIIPVSTRSGIMRLHDYSDFYFLQSIWRLFMFPYPSLSSDLYATALVTSLRNIELFEGKVSEKIHSLVISTQRSEFDYPNRFCFYRRLPELISLDLPQQEDNTLLIADKVLTLAVTIDSQTTFTDQCL